MLFLIWHTHSSAGCPCSKGIEAAGQFWGSFSQESALKEGVKIIGSYVAPTPTEHRLVLVVDAEDLGKVESYAYNRLGVMGETKISRTWTIKDAAEGQQEP